MLLLFPSEGNHRLGHGHGPLFKKQITERTDILRTRQIVRGGVLQMSSLMPCIKCMVRTETTLIA